MTDYMETISNLYSRVGDTQATLIELSGKIFRLEVALDSAASDINHLNRDRELGLDLPACAHKADECVSSSSSQAPS